MITHGSNGDAYKCRECGETWCPECSRHFAECPCPPHKPPFLRILTRSAREDLEAFAAKVVRYADYLERLDPNAALLPQLRDTAAYCGRCRECIPDGGLSRLKPDFVLYWGRLMSNVAECARAMTERVNASKDVDPPLLSLLLSMGVVVALIFRVSSAVASDPVWGPLVAPPDPGWDPAATSPDA